MEEICLRYHGRKGICDGIRTGRMELPDTFSEGEEKYSELFTEFFHTIAIKERTNSELQRGMLPVRYRKYMTEFNRGNTGNAVNK